MRRRPSPDDGRVVLVEATSRGRRILARARQRRVRELAGRLEGLLPEDRELLGRAARVLEEQVGPDRPESRPVR